MAEGAEETESNSNADTPAMLGTVLPCEAITASLCGMKREFDSICVQPSPPVPHTALSASLAVRAAKSPSPSSSSSGNVQQHPINLKSEECEKEFVPHKARSTSPNAALTEQEKEQQRSEYYKSISNNNGRLSPHEQAKVAAATAAAQAHLNGTMQDMINLQKLQNLASMQQQHQQQHQQQQQQQHSSVPGALAGLQGLGGISSAAALNSPLNLSVGSTSTLSSTNTKPLASGALGGSGGGVAGCSPPGGSQMPQLILASGQLVQGVQGAQLLIPTSQGIAVQTILTIPVSQQINTNEQFLQSYAALSSGAVAFNNSTLGPHAMPMQQQASNLLKPNFFSPGVQQLLAALHPELFPGPPHHQPEGMHPLHTTQQGQDSQGQGHMQQVLKQQSGQQPLSSLHRTESMSPKLENAQTSMHLRDSSSPSQAAAQLLRTSPLSSLSAGQHPNPSPTRSSNLTGLGLNLSQEKPASAPTPPSTGSYSSPSGSQAFRSHSPNSLMTSSSHSLSSQVNTPPSVCVLSSINRLTSANGELTITKSHGPPNNSTSTSSSSPSPGSTAHQQSQPMKLSPTTMQISPTGTETSTTDLLVDSPNEPTINQTNCNVVDGIDLDEIKEFAKAFKLRRLSLGLTQTQVGQALSVTEGPAYSQSAICSALAAQMYAAQLSSQQQNMFEKLDITPKSAQKIKPVLERWMKEAEESHWNRYKAGQNHLTDFIGVEPSKKRKRRTSFTPQALELLNAHFERNTHPSGTEITGLAHQLGYEREVIRIWFCNKRQALKNTVRMMSKGMV